MKILLLSIPQQGRLPALNLGLAAISRALKNAGHEVEFSDIFLHEYSEQSVVRLIDQARYDVAGISAMSTQYLYAKWICSALKSRHPNRPVFIGGCLATFNYNQMLLNSPADVCILGEGEHTLLELLSGPGNLNNVQGIAFRSGDTVVRTSPRELIGDIGALGIPDYNLFDIERYIDISLGYNKSSKRFLSAVTTRGCPYNCNYCSKNFPGVRILDTESVRSLCTYLKNEFNLTGISFEDELAIVNKKRGYEICEIMRELSLEWTSQGRANVLDPALLREMKRSGCISMGFGVESGSPAILSKMNKQINLDQARAAIVDCINAGITPHIQMMFGYEGENFTTLSDTEAFFASIPYPAPPFFVTTPLPGTKLYTDCVQRGQIRDETEYLEKLTQGYMSGRDILINLTEFPIDDYYAIKREFESRINRNFYRSILRQPFWCARIIYKFMLPHLILEVRTAVKQGRLFRSVMNLIRRKLS